MQLILACTLSAQTSLPASEPPSIGYVDAVQTAHLFGLDAILGTLNELQAQRPCTMPATLAEVTIRQQLLETVEVAALDVDSALSEISNEEGGLGNLRTTLQVRRDKTVANLNTAALITGSGAGTAVSATQFTGFGSRANNAGDAVGIGAGAASTALSILATRKQKGPVGEVDNVPNMLAPLFDRPAVLHTFYPPPVLAYLNIVPGHEDSARGTRLQQLKSLWTQSGRIDGTASNGAQAKITALTSSGNPSVTVSIADLSDRIAMLVDVYGRVSLIKRDLAALMRSYLHGPAACASR